VSDEPPAAHARPGAKQRPRRVVAQVSCLSCGPLTLDMVARTVTKGETSVRLTPKECQLLTAFMRHPGKILTSDLLMREIWQTDYVEDKRVLHVHIRWLRVKIEDEPSHPTFIQTVRGRGYRFVSADVHDQA
jgi:DNA-binding response OmpR family regulator